MTGAADFPVLHAVRLGGFSSSAQVGERAMLPGPTAEEALRGLERQGLVEFVEFAGSGGWVLTEQGRGRDAALHADEMSVPGVRQLVEEGAAEFERVNPRMVRTVTEWQLATPAGRVAARGRTVAELDELYLELDELIVRLVPAVPRYGRYPRQFGAAAARARDGIDDAIAGVGTLSCHTVWAELHQDFVSGLGRERR
ncbi:hypothetical protein ACWIE7_10100 [Dietzia sp. NPDC055343]